MKKILVLGSLNIDLVQQVARLPQRGETIGGADLQINVGGKGANQACAAALLGGDAAMAGMVGSDVFANRLTEELQRAGVGIERVREAAGKATGSAMILVLPDGDNTIVIAPGANGKVDSRFAMEACSGLRAGDLLLCQLEIPLEAVEAAIREAAGRGVVTMLDPAPARELPDELLRAVTILTPNQTEAALLTHEAEAPRSIEEAKQVAEKLRTRGAQTVIVKLGEQGCLIDDGKELSVEQGFRVHAVDTTAAGDTFNGALAVSLAEGRSLREAAQYANAAAALSVTRPGAISSIPRRGEVEKFLAEARKGR